MVNFAFLLLLLPLLLLLLLLLGNVVALHVASSTWQQQGTEKLTIRNALRGGAQNSGQTTSYSSTGKLGSLKLQPKSLASENRACRRSSPQRTSAQQAPRLCASPQLLEPGCFGKRAAQKMKFIMVLGMESLAIDCNRTCMKIILVWAWMLW